jgi:hypothetical protein
MPLDVSMYVHHLQGACSLLSYFKILFKLMCIKNLCVKCLRTLERFWMQVVSWLVVKINCRIDVWALFKWQYIHLYRGFVSVYLPDRRTNTTSVQMYTRILPLKQAQASIRQLIFTTSQLTTCIQNRFNVHKHWMHRFLIHINLNRSLK